MSDFSRSGQAAGGSVPPTPDSGLTRLRAALAPRYRLVEEIGAGRSGVVFRALDTATGAEVAVKAAAAGSASSALVRQSALLLDEAMLSRRLQHPHILSATVAELAGDFAYCAMPLLGGGTLEDLIRRESVVPLERAVEILREVAGALDHANAAGVVHGALAPSKILFDASGHAAVSDFTIGNAHHRYVVRTPPAYAAPEQRDSQATIDGRADQYSLAIIACEMITGRRRVDPAGVGGVPILNTIDVDPGRPIRPGLPLHVGDAIHRAMNPNSSLRFATATEFVGTLAGEIASTSHGLPTHHGPPPPLRRPSLAVPIALLFFALVATGVVVAPVSDPAEVRGLVRTSYARAAASLKGAMAGTPTSGSVGGVPVPFALGVGTGNGASPTTVVSTEPDQRMAPARATGAAPPADSATPTAGLVTVAVDEGFGAVIVDGLPRGTAPYAGSLGVGEHTVAVRGVGTRFDPSERRLVVRGGDTIPLLFIARRGDAPR